MPCVCACGHERKERGGGDEGELGIRMKGKVWGGGGGGGALDIDQEKAEEMGGTRILARRKTEWLESLK